MGYLGINNKTKVYIKRYYYRSRGRVYPQGFMLLTAQQTELVLKIRGFGNNTPKNNNVGRKKLKKMFKEINKYLMSEGYKSE